MNRLIKGGLWTAALLSAFGLGAAVGGSGDTTTTATPTVTETVTAPASGAKTTKTAEAAGITDGVWLVGEDIAAGRYRTINTVDADCYWEITADEGNGDILQNDLPAGGRPTVTVKAGQQFTTHGCGDWARS